MVFGLFRSIIERVAGNGRAASDSKIEATAQQFADELRAADLLLQKPPYEEPANPAAAEIEHGTHRILDVEAARFLADSVHDPMHAVAWLMARNFGHRPVYLNACNDFWHLGTLSPTYEQWLLFLRKNGHALTVQEANGAIHGPPVALSTLRRVLSKANLAVPEAIKP